MTFDHDMIDVALLAAVFDVATYLITVSDSTGRAVHRTTMMATAAQADRFAKMCIGIWPGHAVTRQRTLVLLPTPANT